jgi:hypothetical protein
VQSLVWDNKIKPVTIDFYGKLEEDYNRINTLADLVNLNECKYSPDKFKLINIVHTSGKTRDEFETMRKKIANCEVLFGFKECE